MGKGAAAVRVALPHGAFNVASGLWPLLHRWSFEAFVGPKCDHRLVATVALFLLGNGTAQLDTPVTSDGLVVPAG